MNFPRYQFAKETEPELLAFLKVVDEQKESNKVDLAKYEVWSKLLPLDGNIIQKLDGSENANEPTIVDLCSDDVPELDLDNVVGETDLCENSDKSNINDIAFAIKETLETHHNLTDHLTKNVTNDLSADELEELFGLLDKTLNSEEIFYLGVSIQNSVSNIAITLFCRNLLVSRIMKEYSDSLSTLVQQHSIKHPSILKEAILLKLTDIQEEEVTVFLQYMNCLNQNYKSVLLRDFLFTIHNLSGSALVIVENLINSQVEYEALNKLVEMLSNIAEDHERDKTFGKLLMNTVQFLGADVALLEKPLKHVIAGHKSVWRSKLEKVFNTCDADTSLFTQSFRD